MNSLTASGQALAASVSHEAPLAFIQPTNNAVFSTQDEIPLVLHAWASNDVFLTADVFSDRTEIGTVSYCCHLCPCFRPLPGQELFLRLPAPWVGGFPPADPWMGWTNRIAGRHWLTAQAVGENGTVVEAAPISIVVLDLTVRISLRTDGTVGLVIPQGSVVEGSYDVEASPDLVHWTRLGSFEPGNMAAFYVDTVLATERERRFYRSVYRPPHTL